MMSPRIFFYKVLHRITATLAAMHPYYQFRKYIFGYAIVPVNGFPMYLDLRKDEGISRELFLEGKREKFTTDHMLHGSVLAEGAVSLDIGANIGYYALIESRLSGPKGHVYAVEPVANNYAVLLKNIALNAADNVTSYRMAFGDREGEATMNVRSRGNLSSLTEIPAGSDVAVVGTETVPITTVDSFAAKVIGRTPDFVRMDVEGYEAVIIEGMRDTMAKKAHLLIEFHPTILTPEQKERMCELLKAHYTRTFITVNPKSEPSRLERFFNDKLGIELKRPGLAEMRNIEAIHELLYTSKRVFNAFILP